MKARPSWNAPPADQLRSSTAPSLELSLPVSPSQLTKERARNFNGGEPLPGAASNNVRCTKEEKAQGQSRILILGELFNGNMGSLNPFFSSQNPRFLVETKTAPKSKNIK